MFFETLKLCNFSLIFLHMSFQSKKVIIVWKFAIGNILIDDSQIFIALKSSNSSNDDKRSKSLIYRSFTKGWEND